MSEAKFENLRSDVDQLKSAGLEKQIREIEDQLSRKKSQVAGQVDELRQQFDHKLALVKLDFAKFRDQISEIQDKTVHEAEKVLNNFSKKKLSSENQRQMRRQELERHLAEALDDRKRVEDQQVELERLRTRVRQVAELAQKRQAGEVREIELLRAEVAEEVDRMKRGEFVREVAEDAVKKMFRARLESGWSSGSGQANLLK